MRLCQIGGREAGVDGPGVRDRPSPFGSVGYGLPRQLVAVDAYVRDGGGTDQLDAQWPDGAGASPGCGGCDHNDDLVVLALLRHNDLVDGPRPAGAVVFVDGERPVDAVSVEDS